MPDEAEAATPKQSRAAARAQKIDAVIEGWVRDRLHNSPVSRDVAAINHVRGELPELKARILKEIA